jgi:hypothetical protein
MIDFVPAHGFVHALEVYDLAIPAGLGLSLPLSSSAA